MYIIIRASAIIRFEIAHHYILHIRAVMTSHPVPARQSAIYLQSAYILYIGAFIYILYNIHSLAHKNGVACPFLCILQSHNSSLKRWEGPSLILPIQFRINNWLRLYCIQWIYARAEDIISTGIHICLVSVHLRRRIWCIVRHTDLRPRVMTWKRKCVCVCVYACGSERKTERRQYEVV